MYKIDNFVKLNFWFDFEKQQNDLHAAQVRPSIWIDLTISSIAFMSVSSSHGLTSNTTLDLAMSIGFLDFFSAYSFNLSSLSLTASGSSSSSDSKRSTSLSSSSSFFPAAILLPNMTGVFFSPGSVFKSYDLMWLYHRKTWGFEDVGVFPKASRITTSAWVGCHLKNIIIYVWHSYKNSFIFLLNIRYIKWINNIWIFENKFKDNFFIFIDDIIQNIIQFFNDFFFLSSLLSIS